MYKKLFNITILTLIIITIYLTFKNYQILGKSLINGSTLFILNVFPFLFIMFFLNNLLIEMNFPYYFQKAFSNRYLYIFLMSMLSGAPTNAIIIESFLERKVVNEKDASVLLSFTMFNSPLFLYYYFHKIFTNNLIIIKLFLFVYLANTIIFILFSKKLSATCNYSLSFNKVNIVNAITKSIKKSINSIINIYATILIFKMISDLFLPSKSLLRGFIEITQGLELLSIINLPIKIKELLLLVFLSFSGLSIHIQLASILKDYNINYEYLYYTRILLMLFSLLVLL